MFRGLFLRTVLWNATATVRARQGYVPYSIAIDCLEIWTRAYYSVLHIPSICLPSS